MGPGNLHRHPKSSYVTRIYPTQTWALEKDGKRHADTTENVFGTSLIEEVKSAAAMFLSTPVVRACFVLFGYVRMYVSVFCLVSYRVVGL